MIRAAKHLCLLAALILLSACPSAVAQDVDSYKFDIGVGLGMSGYLGDANESNMFKHPGFAGNISWRYLMDSRWSLRTQLGYRSLSGNTADFDNVLPDHRNYEFSASVFDIGVSGEFNFFSYGIGETYKRLRRWSPFLSLGIGMCLSSCGGSTSAGFIVPMGFGVRYKLRRRINLSAEFVMTKAFTDHVDGKELSDLYGIKSKFAKNTDWYSGILFSISYEFGPRCTVCNRLR